MRELKDLFIILLSNITFDKDNYRYIFSFLINYINKCNNNAYLNENQENNWNLNSERNYSTSNQNEIRQNKFVTININK